MTWRAAKASDASQRAWLIHVYKKDVYPVQCKLGEKAAQWLAWYLWPMTQCLRGLRTCQVMRVHRHAVCENCPYRPLHLDVSTGGVWRWQPSGIQNHVDQRFRHAKCLRRPDDANCMDLWNVGLHQDYTVIYSKRLSSSYSQPWEQGISHGVCLCYAGTLRG
jgi:hypothetical protein